jgi:hypothetical protein
VTENRFATEARALKCAGLVSAIDARCREQGQDPHECAGQIALASYAWTDAEWQYLAQRGQVNPPSGPETKGAVRKVYTDRVEARIKARRSA